MIFKEVQMDTPFDASGLSADESKEIYENTWKCKRRSFQLMTRCMTSMIERIMPTIKTENYWKLLIECVENNPRLECINMLGVCSVQVHFNIDYFFSIDNYEKKKYVIMKILETINHLCENGYSELDVLKSSCETIKKTDYVNEWFWKKPIIKKQKTVQIKILHEVEKVGIYMVFKDEMTHASEEILLAEDIPDEWVYNKYFGKLVWISDKKAELTTKEGQTLCGELVQL